MAEAAPRVRTSASDSEGMTTPGSADLVTAANAPAPAAADVADLSGRDRITWNVLIGWLGYSVELLTALALPRLVDLHIGQVGLGVWDFAWSCVTYVRLAQIGWAQSAMRYIARYRAMGDVEGLRKVASSTVGVSAGVATLVLAFTAIVVWTVPLLIGTSSAAEVATARWLVALLGAGLAFSYLCEVFSGVLTGCHRWDLHHSLTAGSHAFIALSMIATLQLGGGLRGMALAHTTGLILGELVRMAVAYRICPELRIRPRYWSPDHAKQMLAFGAKSSMAAVARVILIQTNKVVVASQLGPAALALYARPSALLRVVETVVNKFAFVLAPTASSLQGSGRDDEVRDLLMMGTRTATAIVLPLTLGLAILGGPLLILWMGPSYEQGLVLAILAVSFAPSLTQRPIASVLAGLNLHGVLALTSLAAAVLGVSLSFLNVGVLGWGLVGAAVAVGAPMVAVSAVFIPLYACRRLHIRPSEFARNVYAVPLACATPFALVLWLSRAAFADHPLVALVCGSLMGGLVLAPLYWRYLLPTQTREALRRLAAETVSRHVNVAML